MGVLAIIVNSYASLLYYCCTLEIISRYLTRDSHSNTFRTLIMEIIDSVLYI